MNVNSATLKKTAQKRASQPSLFSRKAYDHIVEKICSGDYPPGTHLKEEHLAREIAISATPVREAFRRLEQDRWITIVPYKGATVAELNLKEIVNLYDLRSVLEGLAARLAAENMTRQALDKLAAILEEEKKFIGDLGVDNQSLSSEEPPDLRFHRLIVEIAGNKQLEQMTSICGLQARVIQAVHKPEHGVDRLTEFHKEHCDTLKALEARDADLAEKTTKEHILNSKEHTISILKKRNSKSKKK